MPGTQTDYWTARKAWQDIRNVLMSWRRTSSIRLLHRCEWGCKHFEYLVWWNTWPYVVVLRMPVLEVEGSETWQRCHWVLGSRCTDRALHPSSQRRIRLMQVKWMDEWSLWPTPPRCRISWLRTQVVTGETLGLCVVVNRVEDLWHSHLSDEGVTEKPWTYKRWGHSTPGNFGGITRLRLFT